MINIPYRRMIRIIDLIEEKLVQLRKDRDNELTRVKATDTLPMYMRTKEEETEDGKVVVATETRFDQLISDYEQFRNDLNSELDKIEFKFSVGERDKWNQNQPHNQQNQPKQPENK